MNNKIRKWFYNIPDAGSLIAMKQLNFIGKVVRKEDLFIPKQLLTAWVNNKRKCGGVLTTNRKSIVNALEHLYPANVYRPDENGDLRKDSKGKKIPVTIHMDSLGSLKFWYKDALNKKRWSWMIESKIRSPHLKIPNPSSNTSNSQHKTPSPRRNNQQQQGNQNHLPPSLPPQNHNEYNPEGVGVNLKDSLGILGFSMNEIVLERQVRRRYMDLVRQSTQKRTTQKYLEGTGKKPLPTSNLLTMLINTPGILSHNSRNLNLIMHNRRKTTPPLDFI